MPSPLITESLTSALKTLEIAFQKATDFEKSDPELFLVLRDGVIQRFEYTYEQAWKLMKRVMKNDFFPPEEIESLNRRDLFRRACDIGLIQDPTPWFRYHDARNETSHAYHNERAAAVYALVPALVSDVAALLRRLKELSAS